MFILQNQQLKVTLQAKGAELTGITHLQHGLEYLWNANPAVWAKHSPVLFPIVGTLRDNQYSYDGKTYTLPRHGFARDRSFDVTEQSPEAITFSLRSDADTLTVFPFEFQFDIEYRLHAHTLAVTYRVQNPQPEKPLYFSVGGHPAFKLPLVAGTRYPDYELRFNRTETAGRWPISKAGLIEATPQPLLQQSNTLPLSKALFEKDALVLKHLQSDAVRLQSGKTPHGFEFRFSGFPYLGLWAAPGADFLCIEPWCGIADSVTHNGQLEKKEGIVHLAAGDVFERSWEVQFF